MIVPPPDQLHWRKFEELCLQRMAKEEKAGIGTMVRYGTQARMFQGVGDSQPTMRATQSLPDFDGVIAGGRQFICEAKVTDQASFPLQEQTFKRRQYNHMATRADFGVPCFLAIHFNRRQLKTKVRCSQTFGFPVYRQHPVWQSFEAGETKRLSLELCEKFAVRIDWIRSNRESIAKPNLVKCVVDLIELKRKRRGR